MPTIKCTTSGESQKLKREVQAIVSQFLATRKSFARIHISLDSSGINHIIFKDSTLDGQQKEEVRELLRRFF